MGQTSRIIARICRGEAQAKDDLLRRYLPILRRWAHGRLPGSARTLNETDDLVQITLVKAMNNLGRLRLQHSGSFLFYLKQTLLNQVRDEIRSHNRRKTTSQPEELIAETPDARPDGCLGDFDYIESYERALASLPRRQQQLIVMRLEFGLSYAEIGAECDCSSDAARMMITRAIARLAKVVA